MSLEEMTLQELWQLFPIVLKPHNDEWIQWFSEKKESLESYIPSCLFHQIFHIGSTAIPDIQAKPIVDILMLTDTDENLQEIARICTEHGWRKMNEQSHRISLNDGYTEQGFADRVFHLHIHLQNDGDEVLFCEYLKQHSQTAKEYESLKLSLWKTYEHDRDGYTNAKSEFINGVMQTIQKEIHPYEDIILRSHHVSQTRPFMSMRDRAAQFAPFAALTGYDDQVKEAGRLTSRKIELDENEKQQLDRRFQILASYESNHPQIRVTYFLEDDKKEGGQYVTAEGELKRIDGQKQAIVFMDKTEVSMSQILTIDCDEFLPQNFID